MDGPGHCDTHTHMERLAGCCNCQLNNYPEYLFEESGENTSELMCRSSTNCTQPWSEICIHQSIKVGKFSDAKSENRTREWADVGSP